VMGVLIGTAGCGAGVIAFDPGNALKPYDPQPRAGRL
jgi:hypothetical protein